MKTCTKCGRPGPFYKNRSRPDGLTDQCSECQRKASSRWAKKNPEISSARTKKWRSENPERVRFHALKQRGLTPETHALAIKKSRGKCAICKRKSKNLLMDHNHKTGKFRSLLCICCNTALGKFGDCAKTLRAAANYLEKHEH